MLIIEDNFKTKFNYETYAALGSFDGLHLGHLALINKAVELSNIYECKSMVFTFKDHPLSVINPNFAPKLLMDNDTKISLLNKLNVDIINFAQFDFDFMKISPEEFIKKMIDCYNIKGIIAGFNYRFGYKNSGDVNLLFELSKKLKFELYVIKPVRYRGEAISSSKIRKFINDGNVDIANKLLFRAFKLNGEVIKGKQLGRTIGFPTVNLKYDNNFVIPRRGVYYSIVEYNSSFYKGITNVGFNPTVQDNKLSIETYILNFDKDIYGENIQIYFINRMRDEIKFDTIHKLVTQLENDKKYAENQSLQIF